MTWEPRIIEIQGNKRQVFDNIPSKIQHVFHGTYSSYEFAVIEDEDSDYWVYRDSGVTRDRRSDWILKSIDPALPNPRTYTRRELYSAKVKLQKEDDLEDHKWSAKPVSLSIVSNKVMISVRSILVLIYCNF